MAELQFTRSDWTLEQLEDKSVQFDFENCVPGYQRVYGNGRFQVSERMTGEIAVNITIDQMSKSPAEWSVTTYFLPEKAVRAIKRNPDGSPYDFSCFLSC